MAPPSAVSVAVDYADARAAHEYWKAQLAEQEFRKRAGELLDRSAVEQAAATLYATIAQTIRSWPDGLERAAGLAAAQAEVMEKMIDSLCLLIKDKVHQNFGGQQA
jgi:4-hydroxyphenylpyruvate dioxygenase-like putative hemolysin